ncbi:putative ribonuclease H-like domain-containing protein [Tanacetum coccineum]
MIYPQTKRTFVPSGVLTRTGLVNPVRPNRTRAVHIVSTARSVCTARPLVPKIAQTGSAIRPIYPRMDNVRPKATYSPIKRSYYTKPAFRPKELKQDVKTYGIKNMTTVRTRAVVSTGQSRDFFTGSCSDELKFNLFSVSQVCDKKNSVLFTNTECLIMSPSFQLLDESQVVLRAPRQNDVYSLDLKNIVPSGGLENQLNHKVKIIRYDHGTEFKNHAMNEFCAKKGIKKEFSVARTPQQNGVAERKNRTSIEAARTMLVDLLLPIPFWAEAEYILFPLHPHGPRISVEYVVQTAPEKPSENAPKHKDVQDSEVVAEKEDQDKLKEAEQALKYDLERMVAQEMAAKAMYDATRQAFEEEKRKIASQKRAAQATSINKFNTGRPSVSAPNSPLVSTANTSYASAASTPIGANAGGSSFVYLGGQIPIDASTLPNADLPSDPNIPDLKDDSNVFPNDGIFSGAFDDEDAGAEHDFQSNMGLTIGCQSYSTLRTATTPIDFNKPLVKDEDGVGVDVDVHVYRSMIGSLMYLIASRPDIMFAVWLWYPKDSPFELEAFSNSDYGGASLNRKSTTCGCQFLGRSLISWQYKKQTIMVNSTTEAEYVAAANCCGQVLWIQTQMMDYGFNFMNTKIHIDDDSTICIVKNPVYHSRTKHIEIRHHFIRDCYEKILIDVIKIHTDNNVVDLLTKGFDVTRFNFLVDKNELEHGWKMNERRLEGKSQNFGVLKFFIRRNSRGREGGREERYALTHNPTIYDSLVKQFWQTATIKTLANGIQELVASIDNKKYTITEASIKREHVPLLPVMLAGAAPDQGEGSAIPAGSQPTPDPVPSTTTPPPIPELQPSSPSRLIHRQGTKIPQSQGPTFPFVADEATTTSVGVKTEGATTTTFGLDAGLDSGNIFESLLRSYDAPILEGHTSGSAEDSLKLQELSVLVPKLESKIDSLEKELTVTKQTLGNDVLMLVKKVKTLEVALKRKTRKVGLSESEDEETENQRRKFKTKNDDPLVSLVRDYMEEKEVSASGEAQEEYISPTIFEAAQTLSHVTSQSVSTYKRRVRSADMGKDIGVNTGSTPVSTPSLVQTVNVTIPSPVKGQREGKAPLTVEDV